MNTIEQPSTIRDEKQRVIINAALMLFSERGYHGTSTSMIAKEAGISKGLLFHYIESKEKLIQQICSTIHELIYTHFDTNKDGVLTPTEFVFFVEKSFNAIRENRDFFRLIFSIAMIPDVKKIMIDAGSELGVMSDHTVLTNYFEAHFETPLKEISLFASLTKGATLLYCTEPEFYTEEMLSMVESEVLERFTVNT